MLLESTANCSSADSPEKSALLSFDLRSTLLDSILHIILSFLPAWHSVQMSALLWRWRDLWCSVPFINIDERSFDVRGYDETKVLLQENSDKFRVFPNMLDLSLEGSHRSPNRAACIKNSWEADGIQPRRWPAACGPPPSVTSGGQPVPIRADGGQCASGRGALGCHRTRTWRILVPANFVTLAASILSKTEKGRCSWSQQQSVPVQVDPPEPALLSALPDGVLHIILSFLPAWHAVQTCVLSRRWRDLWCSMPYINIDEREFGVGAYRQIKENWDDFVDFTTNLLLFHRNSVYLDKFQIYAHDSSQQYVDRWIRLGIKYCPSVLEIQIPYYADDLPFKLPHLSSGLSRLKGLRLSNLKLDSHFSELIVSGCPALEDLELTCCLNYFRDIKSSTVRKLVLNTSYDLNYAEAGQPMLIMTSRYLGYVINFSFWYIYAAHFV
ncbi:hypothetical protein C2845_PM12G09590 [Panicum miliaceum]|uniref:F-box domain-containing protein n=1 Tax=Panicum miliaceum TaxID=4540 RepID=A0A3L6QC60_PANMI|nr:hypothetical protein C2845_PM12G09590 [Panicum miliaceum]